MLRTIRITLATVVFALITLLFLDFTGIMGHYLGWLAKIQFLPAVLALNFGVIIFLVALTLIFGRIYCSVICPLGIMQDGISALGFWRKNRYSHSPELRWLRFTVLAIFIVALIAGFGSLVALLAPYSSFGRIVQNLLQPLYIMGNNVMAHIAEQHNSYMFYEREVWIRATPVFVTALATFVIIGILAWRGGRTYCNTICPVGTVLGYLSRFSRLKVVIDAEHCKNCRKCERNCKASCIDLKNHAVDYSRCVVCGNCLEQCKFGAIAYGHKPTIDKENKVVAEVETRNAQVDQALATETPANTATPATETPATPATETPAAPAENIDNFRRDFIITAGVVAATTALAQEQKKVDGGLAVIEDKAPVHRATPLTPPGSLSAQNFAKRCTGCQLCVSKCPNDVLRPATGLSNFMQPTMEYDRGYCRIECNRCSEVCPTGAIQPIALEEKSSTQIGHAVWVEKNCLASAKGVTCGNCARHCPVGAIQMVHPGGDESKVAIPAINEARCIGCGACENLCPSRPYTAIYVEGHEVHKQN